MMAKREFKTVTKRTRQILQGSEGHDVEFKESISGVKSDDLVAFANSAEGGTILIGIRETTTADGHQRGMIIGCDVGDKAKLTLLNRAATCVPPVELELFVENLGDTPFFRVEIPSGRHKPYCTGGGTYKIRGNARTNTLTPSRLLNLFMESESQRFLQRFTAATQQLEHDMDVMQAKLSLIETQVERVFGRINTLHPNKD